MTKKLISAFPKSSVICCIFPLKVFLERSSILQDSISEIGKIKMHEREVNLNADKKRLWFKELKNIEDKIMIDSMPISMNYFEKNQI